MRMTLREFVNTYCDEVVSVYSATDDLIANDLFSFDIIAYNDEGEPYKALYLDKDNSDELIAVEEILYNTRDEFKKLHPSMKALHIYDKYLERVTRYFGADALARLQMKVNDTKQNIKDTWDMEEMLYG